MSHSDNADRRQFLTRLAAGTAALASTSACVAPLVATASAMTPLRAAGGSPPFDDSWTTKVQAAKHRMVFDSPAVNDGMAFEQAVTFMDGFRDMFDARGADVVAVVVMRHMGLALALDDTLWDRYELGDLTKTNDPHTGKSARRNQFVHVEAGDEKALIETGSTMEALRARGVIMLACNKALQGIAKRMAKKAGRNEAEVKAEFVNGLVPGVLLQPSGIYATARAQEAGCTFMRS